MFYHQSARVHIMGGVKKGKRGGLLSNQGFTWTSPSKTQWFQRSYDLGLMEKMLQVNSKRLEAENIRAFSPVSTYVQDQF